MTSRKRLSYVFGAGGTVLLLSLLAGPVRTAESVQAAALIERIEADGREILAREEDDLFPPAEAGRTDGTGPRRAVHRATTPPDAAEDVPTGRNEERAADRHDVVFIVDASGNVSRGPFVETIGERFELAWHETFGSVPRTRSS